MTTETELSSQTQAHTKKLNHVGEKYLTFFIGGETYGIPVIKVREIIQLQVIHTLPDMPAYVRGIINLRGKIIPVVDLRVKFGVADVSDKDQTSIIVVQTPSSSGVLRAIGMMVDGVDEVISIAPSEIEGSPDFGAKLDLQYLRGMAKIKDKVVMLLEIDQVIQADVIQMNLAENQ